MPSTTPYGLPTCTPGSIGQVMSPRLSAKGRSVHPSPIARSPSPSYFEFVAEPGGNPTDSNAGRHAKKNWSPVSAGGRQSTGGSPAASLPESHPKIEAFRRQSQNSPFSLSHGSLSHFSVSAGSGQRTSRGNARDLQKGSATASNSQHTSPSHARPTDNKDPDDMDVDPIFVAQSPKEIAAEDMVPGVKQAQNQSLSDSPSPDLSSMQELRARHLAEGHRPHSVPDNSVLPPSLTPSHRVVQRSETLPPNPGDDGPKMISPQELVGLFNNHVEILLLDLRVYPQFSKSRISGAINLCIPTTLLKRPAFNVQRLAETFTKENEKAKFNRWKQAKFIVVYDATSAQQRDATSSINTLKKFTNEGWNGVAAVIRGGYAGFANKFPDLIDEEPATKTEALNSKKLAIDPQKPGATPVAGGCAIPNSRTAANPFFGSIRQNMDLIGGVGLLAVKLPAALRSGVVVQLPTWLERVTEERDSGKTVADCFLQIERAEQQRMQKALSANVSYGTPNPSAAKGIQIAGIEKGTKNRYKDMLPYDHSRVRLQNVPSGDCDYVNASHIKAAWSNRRYIATQAPVPTTFPDFWRVVWEQDARVVVMLTAESEGNQRKCHPYWLPGDYGPFKLKAISERKLSLETPRRASTNGFVPSSARPFSSVSKRPSIDRRRSTNNSTLSQEDPLSPGSSTDPEVPHVIVRKLALSNVAHPFEPIREITQLQYSSWPDFGTPAHPAHVLGLVEHCGAVVRSYGGGPAAENHSADLPAAKGERPIVVHCSAGCGRTGTFCTVDSVIDMLKRQRQRAAHPPPEDASRMQVDTEKEDEEEQEKEDDWLLRDDTDLVARAVADFRLQRLSMVQTLKQFVLCYESVLEWLVREEMAGAALGVGTAWGTRKSFFG